MFSFANLIGDSGDSDTSFRVNAIDLSATKRALNTGSSITGRLDFNRDGRVNALDLTVAKRNLNASLSALTTPAAAAIIPVGPAASTQFPRHRAWDERLTGWFV